MNIFSIKRYSFLLIFIFFGTIDFTLAIPTDVQIDNCLNAFSALPYFNVDFTTIDAFKYAYLNMHMWQQFTSGYLRAYYILLYYGVIVYNRDIIANTQLTAPRTWCNNTYPRSNPAQEAYSAENVQCKHELREYQREIFQFGDESSDDDNNDGVNIGDELNDDDNDDEVNEADEVNSDDEWNDDDNAGGGFDENSAFNALSFGYTKTTAIPSEDGRSYTPNPGNKMNYYRFVVDEFANFSRFFHKLDNPKQFCSEPSEFSNDFLKTFLGPS